QIKQGMIVKSAAGHDKGSYYVVVKAQKDFVFIADGRRRKCSKPKKKSNKHVYCTAQTFELDLVDTDKKIRRVLHTLNNDVSSVAE
ncbi:MAG: KOW domain-containing RNA-binding protein, partial [Niameybacter sp.]